MLAASASLGAVLVHDGEVGTDEAKLAYADEGDRVDLKGDPVPFDVPVDPAWATVQATLHGTTVLLGGLDFPVLLTGLDSTPTDEIVVHGAVVFHGDHPDGGHLLVVDVLRVDEPYFDWA